MSSITPALPDDLRVLLIEDDEIMRVSLARRLLLEGIAARCAATMTEAMRELERGDIDLVVSDIRLPDGSGQALFEHISSRTPGLPVMLMTAYGAIDDAVALIKAGAADYLVKPFEMDAFLARVRRHLARAADMRLGSEAGIGLGRSPAMRRIERLIVRLRDAESSVLVTGESGVGKEVVASLIHQNSRRKDGPLVRVNCAAIPSTLVESELFGHEKGAFTGADSRRIGRFERAQGGSIFLDEIAEMPLETQVKLLRVLQEHSIERVGSAEPIALDVRVIAATQVDLPSAIKSGRFRADLYWRLNVLHIALPPLRERREDVLPLARQFARQDAEAMGKPLIGIAREAEAWLLNYDFPGNVRELKNMIERAVALCDGTRIEQHDLDPVENGGAEHVPSASVSLKEALSEAERRAIHSALALHEGAIGRAADTLGISRKSLWEKMRRYGISARG